MSRLLLVTLAVWSLAGRPARADEWHSGAEVLTDAPLGVGGRMWGEGPLRIRLEVALEYLPGGYVGGIQRMLVSAGAFDRGAGDAIESALGGSLTGHIHIGWRPLERAGLYLAFGYRIVAQASNDLSQSMLSALAHQPPPANESANGNNLVQSNLHMLEGEVGWIWLTWDDRVTLRVAAGVSGAVGSTTHVSPLFMANNADAVRRFDAASEAAFAQAYRSFVTPYLTLAIGYNFRNAGKSHAPNALPAGSPPFGAPPFEPGFNPQ